jgi:serine protease AprX
MSGTSMATPHVAGIVALLFEANPALTPAQVKQHLVNTADPMPGRTGFEVGAGHVDAYAAGAAAAGH